MRTRLSEELSRKRLFIGKAVNVALIVCLVAGYSVWAEETALADAETRAQMLAAEKAAHRGSYATDGVYAGSAEGYGGPVEVEVTIENGYIEDVQVVSAEKEDAPYLEQAETLLDAVLEEQTTDVDVVSGCTYSSVGILNGVTEALQKSNAGEEPDGEGSAE